MEKIPKVELHVHLDGSARPSTVAQILKKDINDVKKNMMVLEDCKDLNDYLSKFSLPNEAMQTEENLTRIAYELCMDLQKENVIYAEIRFAPNKHTTHLTLHQVVDAVLLGLKKSTLKTNLILCMMRNDSKEKNLEIINLAYEYLNKGVVAIDLAGAEAIYPTKDFQELFKIAKAKNIPFTIHAGEADGPKSIQNAIDFGATRIGHGIRAIEDLDIVEQLIKKQILLEICPTSNLQTKVVKNYQSHPIHFLYQTSCLINISTDNKTVSNTTLENEYRKIKFTKQQIIQTNLDSIKNAFLSEEEKEQLMKVYQKKLE